MYNHTNNTTIIHKQLQQINIIFSVTNKLQIFSTLHQLSPQIYLPNHSNTITSTIHSKNNITHNRGMTISNKTVISLRNSSINTNVNKLCKIPIIDHRNIPVQTTHYNTTRSKQSKSIITSEHEPILIISLTNKLNKYNSSIHLLVDVDIKQGRGTKTKTIMKNNNKHMKLAN